MNKWSNLIKFEYIYSIIVVLMLGGALFYFKEEKISLMILGALISSSSAISTFFFTKHDPRSEASDVAENAAPRGPEQTD